MESLQAAVRAAFSDYDADGSGYIEREELLSVLRDVNPDLVEKDYEAEKLLAACDADKDGRISLREFCDFVFQNTELAVLHTWHLADGRVQQKFLDGRTRMTFSDGCTVDVYKNGLKHQTHVDGTVLLIDPTAGVETTIKPDGTTIVNHADGRSITKQPDGTTITKESDGTTTQIDSKGVWTATSVDGVTTSHFANGAVLEVFSSAQAESNGVRRVQRCAAGELIVVYTDGSKLQFNPADGILIETYVDGSVLQRFADGHGFHGTDDDKISKTLSKEEVLAEIDSGRSRMPREPGVPPIVPFSKIASSAAVWQARSLATNGDEKGVLADDAAAAASVRSDEGVTEELKGGVFRTTFPDGRVLEKHPNGTIVEKQDSDSSQSRQTNPDGTVILIDSHAGSETTIRTEGTYITKYADGHTVQRNKDGTTITTAVDGTETQVDPKGNRITRTPNGDTTLHRVDGTIVETFASGGKRQIFPDGCIIVTLKDGTTEQTDADGLKVITLPDGSYTMVTPSGSKIEAQASGEKLQTDPNGCQIRTFVDGRRVQRDPCGRILETLADGTFRQCEPDGSGLELSADNKQQWDFPAGSLTASLDGISGTDQKHAK